MRDQNDTRTRIQEVALELFTDQGYEATSLREIAERLGVTKAALYYHFKTKEDIVASLMDDRVAAVEELLEWARPQPNTPELRRDFIRRYADQMRQSQQHKVMRFLERNQTALREHPKSEKMRDYMFNILDMLCPPGEPLTYRLKTAMAVFTLHAAWFVLRDDTVTDDERQAAGLAVALDLIDAAAAEREPHR